MAKQKPTPASKPDRLAALDDVLGTSHGIEYTSIDPTLIWMALVALLRKGAAMHLGTTRAADKFVLTIYDGDFPRKQYLDSVEELHRVLAAVVKVYERGAINPEWAGYVEQFER